MILHYSCYYVLLHYFTYYIYNMKVQGYIFVQSKLSVLYSCFTS